MDGWCPLSFTSSQPIPSANGFTVLLMSSPSAGTRQPAGRESALVRAAARRRLLQSQAAKQDAFKPDDSLLPQMKNLDLVSAREAWEVTRKLPQQKVTVCVIDSGAGWRGEGEAGFKAERGG